MNLRDLEYIVAVADHLHFGRAADACFVSQPTLSMQVRKVEGELGVNVFERSKRKVIVTTVGEEIVRRSRALLQDAEGIIAVAKAYRDPFSGELKLGIFPTLAPYLLPQIVPEITRKFPRLNLLLVEEKTERIVRRLIQGELDAILVSLPNEDSSLEFVTLFSEPFLLAVSSSHPFSKKRAIRQSCLTHQHILLLEDGHCLRNQALEVCSSQGAIEHPEFRATSLETLRHMVANDAGITLIPEMAVRGDDPSICYIPFSPPQPQRTIGMVWRKTSCRKKLFSAIAKLIQTRTVALGETGVD